MKIEAIRLNITNKIHVKPQIQKANYKILAKDEVSFTSNLAHVQISEANSYADEAYNPFNGILDNFSVINEVGNNLIGFSRKAACDGYNAWWDAICLIEALDKAGANENSFILDDTSDYIEIAQLCEDGKKNIARFDKETNKPIEYRIGVQETFDGYSAERIYRYNSNESLISAIENYKQEGKASSWKREFVFDDNAEIQTITCNCTQTPNGLKTAKRKYDYKCVGETRYEKLIGASYDYVQNQKGTWVQAGKKFNFEGNILKSCAVGFEECKNQNKTEADRIFVFANRGRTLNHVLVDYSSQDNKKIAQKCFTYDLKTDLPQDCKFIYEVENMF